MAEKDLKELYVDENYGNALATAFSGQSRDILRQRSRLPDENLAAWKIQIRQDVDNQKCNLAKIRRIAVKRLIGRALVEHSKR